jgi:cystathionine beta-lyase/cystathionine gamma-synthase
MSIIFSFFKEGTHRMTTYVAQTREVGAVLGISIRLLRVRVALEDPVSLWAALDVN